MSFIKRIWILVTSTFRIWEQANSSRMAAAMTYYTMLSLAPLLMIAVAIAGYVYDDNLASKELIEQVGAATSPAIAEIIAGLISNATRPSSGILASSISLLILFYGASGVFSQLYETFNVIWQVPVESRTGFKFTIQKRLIGIGMVLIAGVSLIGTVALGSVIAYLEHLVQDSYPLVTTWLNLADRSLSLLLMPFVLALMFWFFPATKIKWRDVWPAGVLTALLIAASRYLIEFYLRFSSTSEVYGAAGSLVVLLIWIYITGLVVFFGAAFSHAWSDTFGSRSQRISQLVDSSDSGSTSSSYGKNGGARTIDGESPGEISSTHEDSTPPILLERRTPES
jgi:membrane protein